MLQRRRIATPRQVSVRPTLAIVLTTALAVSAAFGGNQILQTQNAGPSPIDATSNTASFASGDNVVVEDAAISAQSGESGPRTVKEFSQDERFSMFAVTWTGTRDIAAFFRAQRDDGSWSEWYDADPVSNIGPNGENGTELIYVEPTNAVQVSITGVDILGDEPLEDPASNVDISPVEEAPVVEEPIVEAPAPVEPAPAEPAPVAGMAPLPSNYGDIQPVADVAAASDLDVVFIDGGIDEGIALATESTSYGMPDVVTRAGWGANESARCRGTTIDDETIAATVHHTAGSNNYSQAASPGIMRGMYDYHARTLGWCDIGYNAVVDKFGTIYEGRYGGLDKGVQGAHVGGFNKGTFGISMMGNYDTTQTTPAMINSVGEMIGWKAAVAGFDPQGKNNYYTNGFSGSKFSAGTTANLPNIFAHRDAHYNACPGQYGYAQMDNIRSIAAATSAGIDAGTVNPSETTTETTTETTPAPSESTSTTNLEPTPPEDEQDVDEPVAPGTDALTTLSSAVEGDQNAILAVVGTIAAVAITSLSSGGINAENTNRIGDVEVLADFKVSDLTPIISTIVSITGDSEIEQTWSRISTAFGPVLGEPRSGITPGAGAGAQYALFDNGIIVNSDETPARGLWGAIADTWAGQGFDLGPLGLPLSEEYAAGDLLRVDFEGGFITFDPATGQVDVKLV